MCIRNYFFRNKMSNDGDTSMSKNAFCSSCCYFITLFKDRVGGFGESKGERSRRLWMLEKAMERKQWPPETREIETRAPTKELVLSPLTPPSCLLLWHHGGLLPNLVISTLDPLDIFFTVQLESYVLSCLWPKKVFYTIVLWIKIKILQGTTWSTLQLYLNLLSIWFQMHWFALYFFKLLWVFAHTAYSSLLFRLYLHVLNLQQWTQLIFIPEWCLSCYP